MVEHIVLVWAYAVATYPFAVLGFYVWSKLRG